MNDVICKFKCEEVKLVESGGNVVMKPVISGSEENRTFFSFTPYGEFNVGLVNANTVTYFVPGNEYYVSIRKAN